jgi:hypothetical protein
VVTDSAGALDISGMDEFLAEGLQISRCKVLVMSINPAALRFWSVVVRYCRIHFPNRVQKRGTVVSIILAVHVISRFD